MPNIGPMELIVVLVIALVVLGPKRLPSAGRSMGEGLRGFKESLRGDDDRRATVETLDAEVVDEKERDAA